MELRQGPLGVHLRHPAGPAGHAAGTRRRRGTGTGLLAGGARRRGGRARRGARPGRGARRRPAHPGGRLRLRQVRPDRPGNQRHRPARPPALARLAGGKDLNGAETAAMRALAADGAVIMAGERLAEVPGALSAVAALADATGAKLAWVPRRAGERGAIDAGALPGLLPLGRPVSDPEARAEVARVWGVGSLPDGPARDAGQILAAAAAGNLDALLIAGVDPGDLPDEQAALGALAAVPFVVSLEIRASAITD